MRNAYDPGGGAIGPPAAWRTTLMKDGLDDQRWRARGPGSDWRGLRPEWENPLTWSLPLGRIAAISLRMHAVFLLYVLVEMGRAFFAPSKADPAPLAAGLVALNLACLFGLVLLHEFGHCFACRRVGGEADEILLWPLGGLAFCAPPHRWRAHFVTAAGGPLVNVAIFAILAPVLGALTGSWWGVAVPDPWHHPSSSLKIDEQWTPLWLEALYSIHVVNVVLLLFNLLPVFPFDGGRIVQSLAWARIGYARATTVAVYVGYFGAIALGLVGAVQQQWLLVGIAAFGGMTCYLTLKQLQWTEAELSEGGESWMRDEGGEPGARSSARAERATRRVDEKGEKKAAEVEAEVDRILEKIAREGMQSLSGKERRLLRRATAQRQRAGGGGDASPRG